MTFYNFVMYLIIFLFVLAGLLHLYAAWYFKKNEGGYRQFLQEYQRRGLQLDLMTKVASYSGFYTNYQKIAFFTSLKKRKAMRFTRTENVRREAYDFVQQQPAEVTAWMCRIRVLYQITFTITLIWLVLTSLFVYVMN